MNYRKASVVVLSTLALLAAPMLGTAASAAPGRAPDVARTSPANNATGVAVTVAPTAAFTTSMRATTIRASMVTASGVAVPITTTYLSQSSTAQIRPQSTLAYSTTYKVTISGTSTAGVPMSRPYSWSFRTVAPPDSPPVAALTVTPSSGTAPLSVTADASASTDTDRTGIASYRFDFGDGTAIGPQKSAKATHNYRVAGTYTVTVRVVDTAGLVGTATVMVVVSSPPPPNVAPTAALTVTPNSGPAPLSVTADASASTDTDAHGIATFTFDFGDGTVVGPQAGATATHTYTAAGSFTVTVTVTDTGGLSGTTTAAVTATVRPINNDCSAGTIAFTFDDGPDVYTQAMMQALQALNLSATFFVIGEKVAGSAAGQQTVRDEVAAGFSVQNHTYDHASFTGASTATPPLTDAQIQQELDDASAAIVAAGAPKPTLYRPPYGDIDAHSNQVAAGLGYRVVMPWSAAGGNIVDSRDWTSATTDDIVRNVTVGYTDATTGQFYPGMAADAIIAMHDGSTTAPKTIDALQPIVDYMNANHFCSTATIRPDATGGVDLSVVPPEPTTGNLVQNPSLETMHTVGGVATDVPECFQRAGSSTASNTATWTTTTDAHTGSVAEQVDVTAWSAGDRKLVLDMQASHASCLAAVTPGTSYSMWVWFKGAWTQGTGGASVGIVTYYRTGTGTTADPYVWNYWQSSHPVTPATAWQLAYFTTAPLPAGANAISFGLAINGVGTLITDDYFMAAN